MVKTITDNGKTIAIILGRDFNEEGIHFFTPNNLSQQLAYMNRPEGYTISPHVHKKVSREVEYTLEVLFIKSGKVQVDLYREDKSFIQSEVLHPSDVILLVSGGHGFQMLEPSEIIEVKQGPYIGENNDKERFVGIEEHKSTIA